MRRASLLLLTVFALCRLSQAAEFPKPYNSEPGNPQPLAPAEALAKLKLPAGFSAQLFAAEPRVQNPIAMAWDAKGRLWIAENYTYAERCKRFELGLRDRVIILEDADHDGQAERRTVFTDQVQMLTSVEVGRGGVWLMCPPQVLFIPDANGDDVPDAQPQVVLDGFTVAEANYHNFANGLRWGPDGWLYGRCGHSCPGLLGVPGTPAEQRVAMKGGLWRYHPERHTVEVLTHGTTNPWGHDWDKHGECFFINTVTGHLWHLMPGAHLMDGSPPPNPFVYDRLDTIADHYHFDRAGGWQKSRDGSANDLGGGHAHIGMMIYQGSQWPEVYRDKLFTLNMHGRRANVEKLERLGCGYVGRHQPDVFFSDDPWFRGIDLSIGPDGSAYVLDWSDTGECHDSTGVHRTSGRIYRLTYGQATAPSLPFIQPRCLAGEGKLPALWRDYQQGKTTPASLRALLRDDDEHVRVWAIRLLTDHWPLDAISGPRPGISYPQDEAALAEFIRMAREDRSSLVALVLASTLQRLPLAKREALAIELAKHSEYADDAHLPTLLWQGFGSVVTHDATALVRLAQQTELPLLHHNIARCLSSRMDRQPEPLTALLTVSLMPGSRIDIASVLEGMTAGTRGWQQASKPADWDAFAQAVLDIKSDARVPFTTQVNHLNTLFGEGIDLDVLSRMASDAGADLAGRQAALSTLADREPARYVKTLLASLNTRGLTLIAARGLAKTAAPESAKALVQAYRKAPANERPALLDVLTSRPVFALALLDAISTGSDKRDGIPRAEITAYHARLMLALKDEAVTAKLKQAWGDLRESGGDKAAAIAQLKAKATPAALAKADRQQGRMLFKALCSSCHTLYGEGGKIGPDLTGSGRANLDYLVENIADPSGVVSADYRMTTLTLKDGRTLSGLIAEQTERTLTLKTLSESITLERSEVQQSTQSSISMMPEGLAMALTDDMLCQLLSYLMHPSQVPLPGE